MSSARNSGGFCKKVSKDWPQVRPQSSSPSPQPHINPRMHSVLTGGGVYVWGWLSAWRRSALRDGGVYQVQHAQQ